MLNNLVNDFCIDFITKTNKYKSSMPTIIKRKKSLKIQAYNIPIQGPSSNVRLSNIISSPKRHLVSSQDFDVYSSYLGRLGVTFCRLLWIFLKSSMKTFRGLISDSTWMYFLAMLGVRLFLVIIYSNCK